MVLAIGIDLGTANTRVAVFRNDQYEVIPHEGRSSLPSIVAFTERVRLIGEAARIHGNSQPQSAIYGALSFLGVGRFGDLEMDALIKDAPFHVTDHLDTLTGKRRVCLRVFSKGAWTSYDPLEILAMVLKRARKDAESYLGYTVSEAVITVPAMFDYAQRYAIRDAAAIAGIKPLLLMHPPAAALMDLLITRRKATEEHVVLICDVGARYINITCAMLECGIIETRAVAWGVEAGDAFTRRLVRHMILNFANQWPNDNDARKLDSRAMHRLRRACEHAKHQLSSMQETVVEIEALHKGRDLKVSITRTRFEELIQDLVRAIIEPLDRVLREAKIDKKSVDDVILIGGSSRIPKIQQVVSAFFDGKELLRCLNAEESAVRGAAVEAAVFSGDTSSESTKEVLLLDVLTRNLGIDTAGGVMTPITRRTDTIPTRKSSEFLKLSDANKSGLAVTIFEGDRARTKDCLQLGRTYVPIPADPGDSKGVLVDFLVDRHNILTVEVTDRNTGKSEKFEVDGYNKESFDRLSVADLERLREAELRMQIEDDIEQRRVEARNTLEELLYSIKAWSAGFEEHQRADDVSRLCVIVDAILAWLDTDVISSASEFESRTKELQKRYEDAVENQARWTDWIRRQEAQKVNRERTKYDRLPRREAQKGYRERRTTQEDLEDQKKSRTSKTRTDVIQAAVDLATSIGLPPGQLAEVLDSRKLDRDQDVASDNPYAPQPMRANQNPDPMPYSPAPPVEYSLDQETGQGFGIKPVPKVAESRPEASDLNQPASSTVIASSNDHGKNQKSPSEIEETRAFLSPMHERLATMTPDSIERSATPRTAQRGLASLFTVSPDSSYTYTDTEFIQISTYLKNTGQPDWSLVPRLYTVLRLIGGLDMLGVFIEQGITDIWFPFGPTTLPRVLTPTVKANFLKYQDVVLSKSLLFEKSPERKHVAFQKGEPLPYEVVGKLGAGAHGQVDKVLSTVSHREYARKLFQRMRGMRKDAIKSFLTELQVLKRIQHYHCVELVGKIHQSVYSFIDVP